MRRCWNRAVAGSVCLLALTACGPDAPRQGGERTALVQLAAPMVGQGGGYVGEIRARHEADLAFRVGGKLLARAVDVGAEVRSGQTLARLDPADLELVARAAAAQRGAAESDLRTAEAERDRYAGLLAKKFVSQAAFDARENAVQAAQARLAQAQAQSRLSGNQAAYGVLTSEFPAVVTAVMAEAGQVVAAGQPVLRVARPEEKEVALAVPEGRLPEWLAAPSLSVRLWAAPDNVLRGELRELAPAADPVTRTYAARVRLIEPPPGMRLGMTAQVAVEGTPAAGVQVPLAAVFDAGDGARVRVVREGRVVTRPVRVARFGEEGAEIAEGLAVGEAVIVAGATRLVDGEAVRPQPLAAPLEQR